MSDDDPMATDDPTTEVGRRRGERRAGTDRRTRASPPPDGIDRRQGERRQGERRQSDRRKAEDDPEQ